MSKEEFEKFKPKLDQILKADKHFFWSGGTKIAKQNGGNTLEGNNIKMPGWINDPNDPRKPLVQEKWDYVSETFAKNSNKDTHVVFPYWPGKGNDIYPHRREDNVFDVTEYPRLESMGIDHITKHNAETGHTRPYRHTK